MSPLEKLKDAFERAGREFERIGADYVRAMQSPNLDEAERLLSDLGRASKVLKAAQKPYFQALEERDRAQRSKRKRSRSPVGND